jgi:hypothetical protein
MTVAAHLLARLADLGVRARAVGDEIRLLPIALVPPELRAELAAHKGEVLGLLRSTADACSECGSTEWAVSLVDNIGRRTCSDCASGRTALRRSGASL